MCIIQAGTNRNVTRLYTVGTFFFVVVAQDKVVLNRLKGVLWEPVSALLVQVYK